MAPAVTVASGQGFTNPVPARNSAFHDFLTSRRATLDLRDAVPEGVSSPDQSQISEEYLLLAVGYWWKIVGIRWSAVGDVVGALHVLAVLGVYSTLRLFLPLLLSGAGALWMCTSTLQLSVAPHIRDYSKGAFILAAIPFVVALAVRARSRAAMLALAATVGVVIGLGIGFKMDVAVMAPIAIACIVLFRSRRPWTGLLEKGLAIAVLTFTVMLTAYPVTSRLVSGGSNAFHVALLGYADPFDDNLGITRSVYRYFPYYDDGYIASVVNARAEVSTGHAAPYTSPAYDRASTELWTGLLRHFPADAFVRLLGAANGVSFTQQFRGG